MNLVFYSPQFLPSVGGLQNMVHYWAQGLTNKGHSITVICQTQGEDPPGNHYSILRNPGFSRCYQNMRKADAVLMFNTSLKALPICMLSGKPLIISHHTALHYDGIPLNALQWIKKNVANYLAKANIACSSYIGRPYRHCQVVPNTYDPTIFKEEGLQRKAGGLLFAGRLVSDKGIDLLLDAHSLLEKQRPGFYSLSIIGEGPELASLRIQVHRLGLGQLVQFMGSLPSAEVARQMNLNELLVVPSRMEPFGLVVLEGLACGCRLLLSKQGGLPEAGGAFADYIAPGSAIALADAIQKAMDVPVQTNSNEIAVHLARFSPENSLNRLESVLKDAIHQ